MRVTKQKPLAQVILTKAACLGCSKPYASEKSELGHGPCYQLGLFSWKVIGEAVKDQNREGQICLRSRIGIRDLDDRLLFIQLLD